MAPVDGELSKISVDMWFDPERSFAASPGDHLYRQILKCYLTSHQKIGFDEVATECERGPICTIEAVFR